jgi:hypothetical protein
VRKPVLLLLATAVVVATLLWSLRVFGAHSAAFSFFVVWLPMTWLGTVGRLWTPRLPQQCHDLRSFERSGRIYELLGVRVVKAILRRGPLAVFNPRLHLPPEPSAGNVARLEQSMRDAEASHAILLVLTLGIVVHAAARGWWTAAWCTLLFDVLVNGYPVMLQRYNRALLARRFPSSPTS